MISIKSCGYFIIVSATGDLLIGRESRLSATSTCGLEGEEGFCIVSNTNGQGPCKQCDTRRKWSPSDPTTHNAHNIENIIAFKSEVKKISFRRRELMLFQRISRRLTRGVGGSQKTAKMKCRFKSTSRPNSCSPTLSWLSKHSDPPPCPFTAPQIMALVGNLTGQVQNHIILKSRKRFSCWESINFELQNRHFAEDCASSFPDVEATPNQETIDQVVCDDSYGKKVPTTNGELVLKVIFLVYDYKVMSQWRVRQIKRVFSWFVNFLSASQALIK